MAIQTAGQKTAKTTKIRIENAASVALPKDYESSIKKVLDFIPVEQYRGVEKIKLVDYISDPRLKTADAPIKGDLPGLYHPRVQNQAPWFELSMGVLLQPTETFIKRFMAKSGFKGNLAGLLFSLVGQHYYLTLRHSVKRSSLEPQIRQYAEKNLKAWSQKESEGSVRAKIFKPFRPALERWAKWLNKKAAEAAKIASLFVNDDTKQAVADAVGEAVEVAHDAVHNLWIRRLAQAGFYAKGMLYLVIGCLAIAAVVGVKGADLEDPRGALAIVASKPYGRFLLLLFLVGAIGHGLWNILRAVTDVDGLGSKWFGIVARSIQGIIGCFYIGLSASAIDLILASRISETHSAAEETFVSVVLTVPLLGAGFIGIIGLGLVGAGFTECYNGLSGRFQANYRKWEITGAQGILITIIGVVSFTVRAVLLIILGYFFLRASFNNAVDAAIGLDAALFALLDTTYGKVLVVIAGIGLVGHGVLAFYEARYRQLS